MIDDIPEIECPRWRQFVSIPSMTEMDVNRFHSLTAKREGECWEWLGTNNRGRGLFSLAGRMFIAPRIAWALANGGSPDLYVCHTCDNPSCVNPDHLWLGTPRDNMTDASRKGRMKGSPKASCSQGHPLSEGNVYYRPDNGKRQCRTCRHTRNIQRRKTARVYHYADGRVCGPERLNR